MNIDEAKETFPLFEIERSKYGSGWSIQLEPYKGLGSPSMTTSYELTDKIAEALDYYHCRLELQIELRAKFPHLVFYISGDPMKVVSLWVNRNGRDAEAMVSNADGFTDEELTMLNTMAGKAKEEGWFWCSGHQRPERRNHYAYFHFAGKYCVQWREENPEHYDMARKENYN